MPDFLVESALNLSNNSKNVALNTPVSIGNYILIGFQLL